MSLKVLFIANTVMILFVGFVLVQGFVGLNSSKVLDQMQKNGFVEKAMEEDTQTSSS
jgi:hypothetical protein